MYILKNYLIYSTILLICNTALFSQDLIPFLKNDPIIDGYPDSNLPLFKLNEFNFLLKSDEKNPSVNAGYYIAYTEKYFYLFIEAESDSITIRDRAYQNGDGFHLLIGKPQKDNSPTDEFYVLAFSPEKSWCHKMIWYYNIDLKMMQLSNDTKFETSSRDGKIFFELFLPWKDVYPYNPWFSDKIGFNLCFVKAINKKERNYYFIVNDDKIQSEQSKKKYKIINFELPQITSIRLSSILVKNNIKEKEKILLKIGALSNKDTIINIRTTLISGENSIITSKYKTINLNKGFSIYEIELSDFKLFTGGYKIKINYDEELIGEYYITVFPEITTKEYISFLKKSKNYISNGTFNTLMFYINDIDSTFAMLKDYETSYTLRYKITEIENYISKIKNGSDPLSSKKGIYRRAYFSKEDNKFYPYSIYIPENYSHEKKFPLLVYLHGSGDDDRVLSKTSFIPEGFIILAPNGRGTSNCYEGYLPQKDIEESIIDVINNYNIDTTKIILSGFSMGGYGVYRTYYENPKRYKALAILSGHPNLARSWGYFDGINFLEEINLVKFKNVPIYIFHGKNDINCPFELTEELFNKLKKNGCNVVFEIEETGHGNMNLNSRNNYYHWLKEQIK